jgi:hypothetical protein
MTCKETTTGEGPSWHGMIRALRRVHSSMAESKQGSAW